MFTNINKKSFLFLSATFILGLIAFIMSVVAVTGKIDSFRGMGSASIKDMYDELDNMKSIFNDKVISSVSMAYIGSIITIVLSASIMIASGTLLFLVTMKSSDISNIASTVVLTLAIAALGLAIGSIVTSDHVTDVMWLAKNTKHIPFLG